MMIVFLNKQEKFDTRVIDSNIFNMIDKFNNMTNRKKKINACQYYKKRYHLNLFKRSQQSYLIIKQKLNENGINP